MLQDTIRRHEAEKARLEYHISLLAQRENPNPLLIARLSRDLGIRNWALEQCQARLAKAIETQNKEK